MEQVFLYIWRHQNWGSSETVSGHGSTLAQTGMLRAALPSLFRELGIKVLLDIPCGDYNWMSAIRPSVEAYIGADIVSGLINVNQIRYGDRHTQFMCLDSPETCFRTPMELSVGTVSCISRSAISERL